ncbi:MAG: imelysin family protein [Salibacteraceae bacterium]
MSRSKIVAIALVSALIALSHAGCKDKDPIDEPGETEFDRKDMLQNMADAVIIPAYNSFDESMKALRSAHNSFMSSPDSEKLESLREALNDARVEWQHCSAFEFGPAEEQNLRLVVNTFPTDTAQVESNIASGSYDFGAAQNADAKGLATLEYLIFHSDDWMEASQEARGVYFADNLTYIEDRLEPVLEAWNGSYASKFASNNGTDVGSSMGQLVNELNFDYELIKNAKVAIPLGLKTLGVAQPEKVEAFYSRTSKKLILENLSALKQLFMGANGLGLDDHLDALNAKYENGLLSEAIEQGFADSESKVNVLDGTLYDAINESPASVEAAHTAIQNLVILLKTDMPSQLGVQITYQDNDGD